MKRKLGVNVECLRGIHYSEALPLIKKAGFDCYFSNISRNGSEALRDMKRIGDELGLSLEFIHAPFGGINNMWLAGLDYLKIYNGMKESIDIAAELDIPYVIMHVSSGWECPEITEIGLARFDSLVEYAIEKGVVLAFENLRRVGILAYFVDRYRKIDNVRFCYDSGHEHCYTKHIRWMDIFQNKMIATHIHDNTSRPDYDESFDPDYHFLPFDGTMDYERMMRDFDKYGFEGALVLEVNNVVKPEYKEMTHEEFLATCYARIKKISEM